MEFKKIQLNGFKSFADKTNFLIEEGLTGIVGPNGCGKSNIVESLRWVMGETSAKSMRGSGMEDVIFSGTSNKASKNIAEVSIDVENKNNEGPVQYREHDQISVRRKIEKDKGSKFYINDKEVNPFERCKKYLHLIETPYVLRLLEDCAYINLGKDDFAFIQNDISLMGRNKEINVIQYPIIDEQNFTMKGNTVHYPSIKFEDKIWHDDDLWPYYDRSKEEKIYHYLCNNILYRTDFFIKHWNYIGSKYTNHNSAEASKPANSLFKFFFGRKYFYSPGQIYYRCYEKLFHPSEIISNIVITKTMVEADVIHIGYYSTEDDIDPGQKSSGRSDMVSKDYEGVSSTVDVLKVFNDYQLLNKIKFKRDS